MRDQIPSKQNTDRFLEYVAASSCLYSRVKSIAALQLILTVPVPIALSFIAILCSEHRVWAAFYGILISVFDVLIFERLQQERRKEAAKVQERFDCELFELEWNDFKVGDKPAIERINECAERFFRTESNVERIKDWYSPHVGRLPLHLARIVCQRSNIYWDSDLRRGYVAWVLGLGLLLAVVIVVMGLALKMNMETFVLSLLAPIAPTLLWSIREVKKQRDSATTLDRLMKYVQQFWQDAVLRNLSYEEATARSRALQDELFTHRHSNQPIFNWIYKLLHKKYETQMNVGAKELVDEALEAARH